MAGTRAAAQLLLTDGQRAQLEAVAASPSLSYRAVRQAKGLLDAAAGLANEEIGRRQGVSANTVRAWRVSLGERGVAGVGVVAEGRGRRPWPPQGMVAEVDADHAVVEASRGQHAAAKFAVAFGLAGYNAIHGATHRVPQDDRGRLPRGRGR